MSRALRVVVTAGPTREYLDPVRFLSNESSGRMGFAIAEAARARGHRVTLVAGPVELPTPAGVRRLDVVSAREMLAALREAFRAADVLFMTAAVSDYRPRRRRAGKWRKDPGRDSASLELVANPDLLATVARRKGGRTVVAFALETGDGRRRALRKLRAKNADYVVLNGPEALSAVRSSAVVLSREGEVARFDRRRKQTIARALVRLIERDD